MSLEEAGASAIEDAVSSQALSKLIGLAYRTLDLDRWEQAFGETTRLKRKQVASKSAAALSIGLDPPLAPWRNQ
jgi:hypothetical protein